MAYKYRIVNAAGIGTVTDYPECLPTESNLRSMYEEKYVMYKDGKKLSLQAAIAELPDSGSEKPGRKPAKK